MNKHNTIIGQIPALISRSRFEKLVKAHKKEWEVKGRFSYRLLGGERLPEEDPQWFFTKIRKKKVYKRLKTWYSAIRQESRKIPSLPPPEGFVWGRLFMVQRVVSFRQNFL
jgi:hypothetical protein